MRASLLASAMKDFVPIVLDPLYVGDKIVVVFEAIGDDKVRATASSWTDAVVVPADEALEVLALGKRLYLCRGGPTSYGL
jgi:hypothetical protein